LFCYSSCCYGASWFLCFFLTFNLTSGFGNTLAAVVDDPPVWAGGWLLLLLLR